MKISRDIDGVKGMREFAGWVAALLKGRGAVITLEGDLGAGKTTFTQALAQVFGVKRPVASPTFTLVCEYPLPDGHRLVHMDLYRLKGSADLESLGFQEYLDSGDVICIEWPDRAEGELPDDVWRIKINFCGQPEKRLVEMEFSE